MICKNSAKDIFTNCCNKDNKLLTDLNELSVLLYIFY